MILSAVGAALAAAVGFAVSTSAQHHAAKAAPATATGPVRLFRHLAASPLWLFGVVAGALSFALHGLALHTGAIAVVQPIVVGGVVLAVPVKALFNRQRPSRAELSAVTLTASGLAVFLVVAHPSAGGLPHLGTALVVAAAGVAATVLAMWGALRVLDPTRRSMLFGCAGGVLFGLVAGLLKITTGELTRHGIPGAVSGWPAWVMVAAGVGGMYLNQRAYQIAPLAASMPALNTVNVLVALGFGMAVFGETPAHDPVSVAVEVVALVSMAAGLRRLARCTDAADAADVADTADPAGTADVEAETEPVPSQQLRGRATSVRVGVEDEAS